MNSIQIFKTGRHTAMSGAVLAFGEAELQAAADAYDPAVHEAPLTVGHPKDDLPAYGWVKSLAFQEGGLDAQPDQVDEAFAELVRQGKFKKISASFYTPDSPANPKPGAYYLRHVAFLGAQPPAVKGLKPVSFSEAEEGVVEFADWGFSVTGSILRGLREWLIEKFGLEEADKALPGYQVDSVAEASRPAEPVRSTSYSEPSTQEHQQVTPEQLAAQAAELKQRADALTAQEAEFAERDEALKAQERAARTKVIADFCEGLIKEGRVLPKDKAELVAFMEALPGAETVIEFGEGAAKTSTPALKLFQDFLARMPKQVEFREVVRGEGATVDIDSAVSIQRAAESFQEAEEKAGRRVSIDMAVKHVTQQGAKS